jgi:hypothetical protein
METRERGVAAATAALATSMIAALVPMDNAAVMGQHLGRLQPLTDEWQQINSFCAADASNNLLQTLRIPQTLLAAGNSRSVISKSISISISISRHCSSKTTFVII